MRRTDRLITQVRRQTDNEDSSSTQGISDEEFIQYLNDAQDRLQSLITQEHVHVFEVTSTVSLVAKQQAYAIPGDAFLRNRVIMLEYRSTGLDLDYRRLQQVSLHELSNAEVQAPAGYAIRNGNILITPVPSSALGNLRITYTQRLNDMDKKRGTITSATNDGTDYTTITLDDDTNLDATELALVEYVTATNKLGVTQYSAIPVTSYASATRILTLDNGVLLIGGSITTGDFIVSGKYASTHSVLPDFAERYLIAYASWKILKRDSSIDAGEQQAELVGLEKEIVDAFNPLGDGPQLIPNINSFYNN